MTEHQITLIPRVDVNNVPFLWFACSCGWGNAETEEISFDHVTKIKEKHLKDYHDMFVETDFRALMNQRDERGEPKWLPVRLNVNVAPGYVLMVNHEGHIIRVIRL